MIALTSGLAVFTRSSVTIGCEIIIQVFLAREQYQTVPKIRSRRIDGALQSPSARLTTRIAGPNLDGLFDPFRRPMEIRVDGSLDQAMRVLKRKLAKEGVFKEMKKRAFYEKPSVRRKRKRSEAQRRRRKEQRRRRASAM